MESETHDEQTRHTEVVTWAPMGILTLQELERRAIVEALDRNGWVQLYAARELGISARTINYKVKKHKIAYWSWYRNNRGVEARVQPVQNEGA